MSAADLLKAAASAAQAAAAIANHKPIDAARHAIDAVLDLVPEEAAKQMLSDAAVRRANTIADAAELAKFGPKDGG